MSKTKEQLERELRRLQTMQEWTTWQGRTWIAISFTHMMVTMALFQSSSTGIVLLIQKLVMGITVLFLDLGIMHYSLIRYKTKEAGLETPFRVWITYQMMVWSEWIFNFTSLYSNRPPADKMPGALSAGLSFLFGSIVTLSILNTPLIIDLLGKIASDHQSKLAAIAKAASDEVERKQREWEAEQERKQRAYEEEQERKTELNRRNAERRERRLLNPPSTRRLVTVHEDDKYSPKTVNVDEKMVILVDGQERSVDARAVEWLTLSNTMSFQKISDSLGGKPSKAYIHACVKLYREYLQQQEVG